MIEYFGPAVNTLTILVTVRDVKVHSKTEHSIYVLITTCSNIHMRNRDPHRENVENILAICLPIMTMQHISESPSASHAMRKSVWNEQKFKVQKFSLIKSSAQLRILIIQGVNSDLMNQTKGLSENGKLSRQTR